MHDREPHPDLSPQLTRHSRMRMQQRAITPRMIAIALRYGERCRSHDAVCHRITDRSLCGTPYVLESDRLRGLTAVVTPDGALVTAKWDQRLARPGPLRRSNRGRWPELRRSGARRERTRHALGRSAAGMDESE